MSASHEKRITYQDGKIHHHEEMVVYYESLDKGDYIEEIKYHKDLVKYHKQRRAIIARSA